MGTFGLEILNPGKYPLPDFLDIQEARYGAILADPPWPFTVRCRRAKAARPTGTIAAACRSRRLRVPGRRHGCLGFVPVPLVMVRSCPTHLRSWPRWASPIQARPSAMRPHRPPSLQVRGASQPKAPISDPDIIDFVRTVGIARTRCRGRGRSGRVTNKAPVVRWPAPIL
jgi:hypothetical protein